MSNCREREGEPRTKRTLSFARKREAPTGIVEHAYQQCPVCGTPLLGGSVKWARQVLHVPIVPVEVIEHRFVARQCPVCNRECIPPAGLGGEVVGQRRVSAATMALIATLREAGRLPTRTIQWQLETFHGLHLGVGEISEILHRVRRHAAPVVETLKECLMPGWAPPGMKTYFQY